MQAMAASVMARWGMTMTVAGTQTRAFFQPIRSRAQQSMEPEATVLGLRPRGQYLYLGPADVAAAAGDTLVVKGREYLFRRVEPMYCGEETVYFWGLCEEKGVTA